MAKFSNKPKARISKRQNLNMKYKITKKAKQHVKKVKKEARKMKATGTLKKKSKQGSDLPNLYPFKKQVIESLKRKKQLQAENKKINHLETKQQGNIDLSEADVRTNLYETNAQVFVQEDEPIQENQNIQKDSKKYIFQVKKVIEAADIILEVLDARDPLSCRCKQLEREILGMQGEKKIILVLNKIDLVPPGNVDAWLTYLRREFATVIFKANTQQQHGNLSQAPIYKKTLTQRQELADDLTSSAKAIGADKLLELIKNYSKSEGIKTAVTVGVIGYPNVGKSSVINRQTILLSQTPNLSLKRSKTCGVSASPGFTKGLQEVIIDQKVKIIDCPGVVFDSKNQESVLLRNVLRAEQLEDPQVPVEEIIQRVNRNELLLHYKISAFSDVKEFLISVALSRGKLQKGGVPDLDTAARIVLQDWNQGKIKYYTEPPKPNAMDQE